MTSAFVSIAPFAPSSARLVSKPRSSTNGYSSSFTPSSQPRVPQAVRPSSKFHMAHREKNPTDVTQKNASTPLDTRIEVCFETAKKVLSIGALALLLALPPDAVLAARGGGRMGGSSFRAPAMRSAPSRSAPSPYYSPSMGYGYGGAGMFLNPFIMPFGGFGLGFGGLGTFLVLAAIASFVSDAARGRADGSVDDPVMQDPGTTVAVLKVGLLSSARSLQVDLDNLARSADTSSISGLTFVLQETVTSLLRHPDYWAYGSVNVRAQPLSKAEGEFNRLALEERLKLNEETLTNTRGSRAEKARASAADSDLGNAPSEYIVVSLVIAAEGTLARKLPKNVDAVRDVDRSLKALASVSASNLQAVEVIWAPQSLRDTLTIQEMLADHPELKQL